MVVQHRSRQLTLLSCCLALLLIGGIGGLSYWSLTALVRDVGWVNHAYQDLNLLEGMQAVFNHAMTESRGFLVTGDERYQGPFAAATKVIEQRLRELRELTADNPRQQQRLDALEPLLRQRLALSREQIAARRALGAAIDSALAPSYETTRQLTERVRQSIADMEDEEQALLRQRALAYKRLVQQTMLAILVCCLVSCGLLLGSFWWISSEMRRRWRAEEELRALAVELAHRVEERDASLALRDDVLGTVSHDLRSPLSAIVLRAHQLSRMLASAGLPGAEDRLAQGLAHIQSSAAWIGRQLDELLDAARLQAGQRLELALEPVELVALVREEVREAQARTEAHRIELWAAVPVVRGTWDQARLSRVVANLVSNAVKYSPSGGDVTVRVALADGGRAWIEVRDRGIGIPAADLPHLFERFHRGANARRIHGTGLGLFAARQMVEQHGGAIAVSSELGQGTCVTVELPGAAAGEDESLDGREAPG